MKFSHVEYLEMRANRRRVVYRETEDGKFYFCGANNWSQDRDAATRFTDVPQGFRSELA